MAEYITLPIETDPDELAQLALDYLGTVIPGFDANAGNAETWLTEALARIGAEVRDVASDVPPAIFRWYGSTIANLPPIDATQASATSTWTMVDSAGYTIPAGTIVAIPASGDVSIPFEVVSAVTVPPGSSATTAGEVALVAVDAGADGDGLTDTPTLIDPLSFVDSISLVGATSGGADAESDDDYLNRLRSELQLLSPRPILPDDFAVLARRITGVERAFAIDGLIPPSSEDNERAVAVAVVDADGAPCSSGVKTAVENYLDSLREVTFVVNVIDPDYTTVDVDFTAVAHTIGGFDPADVEERAIAAVTEYLQPSTWGSPAYGETNDWVASATVRYFEVLQVIQNVDGLDYVTALTVNGGTSDVALTGYAPLTEVGDITGSVS